MSEIANPPSDRYGNEKESPQRVQRFFILGVKITFCTLLFCGLVLSVAYYAHGGRIWVRQGKRDCGGIVGGIITNSCSADTADKLDKIQFQLTVAPDMILYFNGKRQPDCDGHVSVTADLHIHRPLWKGYPGGRLYTSNTDAETVFRKLDEEVKKQLGPDHFFEWNPIVKIHLTETLERFQQDR